MNLIRCHARSGRGFSLVELVLACAILAMLLVASRSAVYLAAKAGQSVPAQQTVALSAALSDLSADLACATAVSSLTANSVGIVVPDRDGDGNSDAITYSWSGTTGDPLLRTVNGGSSETLVASLRVFAVTSVQQMLSVPGVAAKSTERLVGGNSTGSGLQTYSITAAASRAGSFVPANLGSTATSWNLTRVKLMLRQRAPVSGSLVVQIQTSNAQAPSGRVLGEVIVAESSLSSSYAWKDITFSGIENLSVVNPLAIAVKAVSPATNPCDLQGTNSGGAMVSGNAYFSSVDGGVTWTAASQEDMLYAVYGTPNTPAGTASATGVTSIRITAEASPGVVMNINVPTANVPQM